MSDKRPILTYEAQINRVLPGLIPEIREQVLADAHARIEDLHYGDDNLLIGTGYQLAVNDALAALTQPQTEKCPQCGGDGKGPLTHHFGEPCPTCDGGGAATAADLDPREAFVAGFMFSGEGFNGECHNMSTIEATLDRRYEELVKPEEPGPYAKAFRERVCPVPEFPGIQNQQEGQA